MIKYVSFIRATAVMLMFVASTHADGPFSIDAYTIDGGGGTSLGGGFELSGTIGQPDAGAHFGGGFELIGGFWSATSVTCSCAGDTNADGRRDGLDIASFVSCLLDGQSCQCADLDGSGAANIDDIETFVVELLAGADCP